MYGDNYDSEISTSVRFTRYMALIFVIIGIIGTIVPFLPYSLTGGLGSAYILTYLIYGGGCILLGALLHLVSRNDTWTILLETIGLIASFVTVVFWMQISQLMAWTSFALIVVSFGALCQRTYKWSELDYD